MLRRLTSLARPLSGTLSTAARPAALPLRRPLAPVRRLASVAGHVPIPTSPLEPTKRKKLGATTSKLLLATGLTSAAALTYAAKKVFDEKEQKKEQKTEPVEPDYNLASYCSESYPEARSAFISAAKNNPLVTRLDSIPISAKGPDGSDLSIDIAVVGKLPAKRVLLHFSATHGVESVGSAIQRELLTNSISLPEDTVCILVHSLNAYGMAWDRRTNEKNVDLNRTCIPPGEERISPPLYPEINPIINPDHIGPFDQLAFQKMCDIHGWPAIVNTIAGGQYHFPKGLFYGGTEIAEEPKRFLNWCDKLFAGLSPDNLPKEFVIIDVHTGLGPHAVDTLLTSQTPSEKMKSVLGDKVSKEMQTSTAGYEIKGQFVGYLAHHLCELTKCPPENIVDITQEFGTRPVKDVLAALVTENMHVNNAARNNEKYNPSGPGGKAMRHAFFPAEPQWRHDVIVQGRALVQKSFKL